MLQEQRYDHILTALTEHGYLTMDHVAELFGVSIATARRDFIELEKRDLVERTRGGIRLKREKRGDRLPPMDIRDTRNVLAKEAIARRAASLIRPEDVIIIDGGTTTLHLARSLPDYSLTVITNSLPHAMAINESHSDSNIEIVTTGGTLHSTWSMSYGPQAIACLSEFHSHWAFLSGQGINQDGLFNPNQMVVEVERTMVSCADKIVVLADHTKIGTKSMSRVCVLDKIDILITDRWPENQTHLETFREKGIEVIVVTI